MEGINAIHTGNLTTLSEQELVDCDTMQVKLEAQGWNRFGTDVGGVAVEVRSAVVLRASGSVRAQQLLYVRPV